MRREGFGLEGLLWAPGFVAVIIPFRLALVSLHRRLRLGETWREGLRIGVPMLPTLVFTLVIAQILRERLSVPEPLFGGLIGYALVNTIIPSIGMRTPPPGFEAPQLPGIDEPG